MTAQEPDTAIVRCQRCSDLPEPHVPARRFSCDVCGARVWLSESLAAEIADRQMKCVTRCVSCHGQEERAEVEMGVLPGQIDTLRAAGLTEDDIAMVLALADVAGIDQDLYDVLGRVVQVGSPEHAAWKEALERASQVIAATVRRN